MKIQHLSFQMVFEFYGKTKNNNKRTLGKQTIWQLLVKRYLNIFLTKMNPKEEEEEDEDDVHSKHFP